ncbi:WD40-repeat-containing domain protein [Flagelloscypha sp. PMI_526]|nr:WD40-repeat-containing domain protein [Flagelloscypha sp. PMI_526]
MFVNSLGQLLERIEHGTERIFTGIENIRDNILLDKLEVSRDAPYASAAKDEVQRRSCTPKTRVDILRTIMSWARDNDHSLQSSLFWLFGLAGTGKSTIAQSVCEMLDREGLLASSYFCSIQLDSRASRRLVPTIIRHLASRYTIFRQQLVSRLAGHPDYCYAPLPVQFQELFCAPWNALVEKSGDIPSCVVVIDALDECNSGESALGLILDAIDHGQLQGIKFLLTSRPAPRFVERVLKQSRGTHIALHELSKANVSNDIEAFLQEQLQGQLKSTQIRELASQADGLFIFASTLVKYIEPSYELTPQEKQIRLQQILTSSHQRDCPGLETLYSCIIRDALSSEKFGVAGFRRRLLILQTVVSTHQATSANTIADIVRMNVEDVITLINSLHSVLFTTGPSEPIFVIHASFRDFVVSQGQEPFRCDPSSLHSTLARYCLSRLRGGLKFNICNVQSSFTMDSDLPSPIATVGESLAYACQHWWGHIKRCNTDMQQDMREDIIRLLEEKGLFWIEAMSLLRHESVCRNIWIEIASASWIHSGTIWRPPSALNVADPPRMSQLASEAAKMISAFMSMSPKITSHLYLSILACWEDENVNCWKSQFQLLPRVVSRRIDNMKSCIAMWDVGSSVLSVAVSLNGRYIISGSWDNAIRLWDAETGRHLRTLDGHDDSVRSLAFSFDCAHVVSGSNDNTVRIWDADSWEQFRLLDGHEDAVRSVAFFPDGKHILSGSADKTVRIWDIDSGSQLRLLQDCDGPVTSVAVSPNDEYVVAGSMDNNVRIWNSISGRMLHLLDGHTDWVSSVGVSPDGLRIVSGSWDKTVRTWEVGSGRQLHQLNGHMSSITSVAFSPDGERVASASLDKTVRIWDAASGSHLHLLIGHKNSVSSVAFFPNGHLVVSGSGDETVRIWDSEPGNHSRLLNGHEDSVSSVAFSPDNKRVVSGSWDRTVQIWRSISGKQLLTLRGHEDSVSSVAFSLDGKYVASSSLDKTVRIWDSESGRLLSVLKGHEKAINSVAFSFDGRRVVSASRDKTVKIWDAEVGKQFCTFSGHEKQVSSVSFTPDGRSVVSGSWDKTIRVWRVVSSRQLHILRGHEGPVTSVAVSLEGRYVVSGSYDTTIRIWDLKTRGQFRSLIGHEDFVTSVAFSPDNKRIASGSKDRTVRIWDTESGSQLHSLIGHDEPVSSIVFSFDGKRVVSGSDDNTVLIWNVKPSGQPQIRGAEPPVESVVFLPAAMPTIHPETHDEELGQNIR